MTSGEGRAFLFALLAVGFVLANGASPAAQVSPSGSPEARLARGLAFETAGRPAQALALARSLLERRGLGQLDRARALELEGIAFQTLGEPEKAERALKAAEYLLGSNDSRELAAVLDNQGRVAAGRGDLKSAARLYQRAFALEEENGNHAGMARVSNNQAGIALNERKDRDARTYLERAGQEAEQAPDLGNDARASIASMQGWLDMQQGNAGAALREYRHALQLWRELYGERNPMTAWGLVLAGQAQVKTGDGPAGARTMRSGLNMMAAALGTENQRYNEAERAYAGVLEQMGQRGEALRLQSDVQAKEAVRQEQSCADCAVNGMVLR